MTPDRTELAKLSDGALLIYKESITTEDVVKTKHLTFYRFMV